MMKSIQRKLRLGMGLFLAATVACLVGCSPQAQFNANAVLMLKNEDMEQGSVEFSGQRRADIANVLTALFGTPDDPHVPVVAGIDDADLSRVMDARKIDFAAGPVGSDEQGRGRGLYRKHCAHCHGVTGDGAGPTASFLNPYPRDYRMGLFKFKSTGKGQRPTHEDLKRVLVNGIPGTAMPSFLVLPENEIDALIHYVRYLSIRGEVERLLIDYATYELTPQVAPTADEPNPPPEDRLVDLAAPADAKESQAEGIRTFVSEVTEKWVAAETQVTPVPSPDPERDVAKSIAHGRELFYGPLANCIKCHGDSALGDGQTTDYDDWTKPLEPTKPELVAKFVKLGALEPRTIHPRNLRLGVYRGGRRPVDLYWRLKNGIDGTPMPAVLMLPEDAQPGAKGLSEADLWSLIDYVRNLPYESISNPRLAQPKPNNQRERS